MAAQQTGYNLWVDEMEKILLYDYGKLRDVKAPWWERIRVDNIHIDGSVWHLDVGSSHPGAGEGPKGSAVRRLKWYVSWVQNVVRQFGPYLPWV